MESMYTNAVHLTHNLVVDLTSCSLFGH